MKSLWFKIVISCHFLALPVYGNPILEVTKPRHDAIDCESSLISNSFKVRNALVAILNLIKGSRNVRFPYFFVKLSAKNDRQSKPFYLLVLPIPSTAEISNLNLSKADIVLIDQMRVSLSDDLGDLSKFVSEAGQYVQFASDAADGLRNSRVPNLNAAESMLNEILAVLGSGEGSGVPIVIAIEGRTEVLNPVIDRLLVDYKSTLVSQPYALFDHLFEARDE